MSLHSIRATLADSKLDHRAAGQRNVAGDNDGAALGKVKRCVLLVIDVLAGRAVHWNDDLVAALRRAEAVPTVAPWNELPQTITVLIPACRSVGSRWSPGICPARTGDTTRRRAA